MSMITGEEGCQLSQLCLRAAPDAANHLFCSGPVTRSTGIRLSFPDLLWLFGGEFFL